MKTTLAGLILFLASTGLASAEVLDVLRARVDKDPDNGSYGVVVFVSEASGEVLKRLTTENAGRVMAIELNGKAVWLPTIRVPITNRYFLISNMDQPLAERLASDIMKAGEIGVEVQIPPGG